MKKVFIFIVLFGSIYALSAQKNISTAMQYYKRGISLIEKKNYSEAINVFNYSIKENPKLGIAYYQRGLAKIKSNALAKTNEYTDVCNDFAKAEQYGIKVALKFKKEAGCK